MAENSKIEWTDHTFNPWEGCQKVSPGCDHCYAEARNARFGGGTAINWGPGAPRRRTSEYNWKKPIHWNANHESFFAKYGRRQRVFCASLADVFDNEVDPAWRVDLFALIAATPNLDWLLLTKRIGNAGRMIDDVMVARREARVSGVHVTIHASGAVNSQSIHAWPWPNVWIGATIVNQEEADRDIPKLLAVPARRRFLSMEPLLGPVDLTNIPIPGSGHGHHEFEPIITMNVLQRASAFAPHVHWVIVGGESGPGARPMHPDWARRLRDQCEAAQVPFLFKQWGEWQGPADPIPGGSFGDEMRRGTVQLLHAPGNPEGFFRRGDAFVRRVGKKAAGRLLDDVEHNGFPEDITK